MRLFAVIAVAVGVAALAADGSTAPGQSVPVAAAQRYVTWSIPARQTALRTVSCSRGSTAASGAVVSGPPLGQVLLSGPSSARSWQFRLANHGQAAALRVVVTCVRASRLGPIAATTSSQTFIYTRPVSHAFRVACKRGQDPTGLGYAVQPLGPPPPPAMLPPRPRTHIRFATIRPERGRWIVRAESHGDTVRLTIHARCLRRVTDGRSLIVARSDSSLRVPEGQSSVRRSCPRRFHRLETGFTAGLGIDVTPVPQRDGTAVFRVFNTGPGRRPVVLNLLCLAPRTTA